MKGLIKRFEEKFIKKSPDECWEWQRAKHRFGYGRIMVDGYNEVAHRLSFKLYKGNPGELHVLHKCDNPLCVNPKHLFLGTNQDNVEDRTRKKRTRNGSSSLWSAEQKSIIIEASKAGFMQYKIAQYFKVSPSVISRMVKQQN